MHERGDVLIFGRPFSVCETGSQSSQKLSQNRSYDRYRDDLALMYFADLDTTDGRLHAFKLLPLQKDLPSLCSTAAGGSPDRADALVWALTELMGQPVTPQARFGASGTYVPPPTQERFDGLITEGLLAGGYATSR
jgi:hypothetical protein